MNLALVLSGGIGTRVGADIPKQYIRVRGKMLITYALRPILEASCVDAVQIVAEEEWREPILADLLQAGLATEKLMGFAAPGACRQESVLNGLRSLMQTTNGEKRDTVLIHDAARPCLTGKLIRDCYEALQEHDGVMPVLPMKDTVYESRDGIRVEGLLERSAIYAGQAPELFDLKKYYEANIALLPERLLRINGSTEPALLAGMDIVMIPGQEDNFKVTTKRDLENFERLTSCRDGMKIGESGEKH